MSHSGVWWNRKHEEKATASNAGPALSAALLYGHTGDASTLAWAERVYGFWNGSMTDAASGAVTDHYKTENGSCTEVGWSFTYNEGLMLGAATALANATSAPAYSRDAARFAGHLVLVQTRDLSCSTAVKASARAATANRSRESLCASLRGGWARRAMAA